MLKCFLCAGMGLALVAVPSAHAAPLATATLPEGHVSIGSAAGGTYIIARPIKDKCDRLQTRAEALRKQIIAGEIDEGRAREELSTLRKQIEEAFEQIEKSKGLLLATEIEPQEEKIRFDLGPRQTLLVRADRTRIVGWDEPHVECVLGKTVLATKGEDVAAELERIKVIHRHGVVGPERMILTDNQKLWRSEHPDWSALFGPSQDQEVDVVEIEGLTQDEGNRQVSIELKGPGHRTTHTLQWRRHASLTVYVPQCRVVGIRGGLKGIDVESVDGSLAVLGEGSRDYHVKNRVVGVTGNLAAQGIPLHIVDRIGGDVTVQQTAYAENSSTHYGHGSIGTRQESPAPYAYGTISGDVRLWFCGADVQLTDVHGLVDVRNEFGDTSLVTDKLLPTVAHRLVTESGNIDVRVPKQDVVGLPIIALTECGEVTVAGGSGDVLKEVMIRATTRPDTVMRRWNGLVSSHFRFTPSTPSHHNPIFALSSRVDASLVNTEREAGLDIISRSGFVQLDLTE